MGMKLANLVSLSITTHMTAFLSDMGRPSMKSIEISVQALSGIELGCSNPGGLTVS
ncbi:hypothetical protein RchiOBHm_Chr7g0181071 [Rosa chinensis]|uniref:Uncharacterized protein n=1 Tax=Rosa chinensis TaxID=74649 RepID=A0A2P6P2J9_ROSCH|nr:hypothetical protein RchiOBHm_Chr7g0181071 [Rosa chinensis]